MPPQLIIYKGYEESKVREKQHDGVNVGIADGGNDILKDYW